MSEVIVLDTHIWFWWINQEFGRFPDSWLKQIDNKTEVGISPVSCYEIALAQKKGRLELPCATELWFRDALTPADIKLLPLTDEIACKAVNLSPIHKDPFDRIIIATALVYNAKLASLSRSQTS